MATTPTVLPPTEVESTPKSTPTPPLSETSLAKQDQPDMAKTQTLDIPLPPFINSIDELRSLSTALSTFLLQYDELNNHIHSINSSIDSKLPNHLLYTDNFIQSIRTPLIESNCDNAVTTDPETMVSEQNPNGKVGNCERSHEILTKPESPKFGKEPEEYDTLINDEETDISKESEETDTLMKHEDIETSKEPEETDILKETGETDTLMEPERTDISKKPVVTELEMYCKSMRGKDVKRYASTNISDMNKLRKEIPKALKLAKDPAKLVLQSVGRFFIQGSGAYSKNPVQVVGRMAAVVILECFVMIISDGIEIAKEDKEYAAKSAAEWRRRMINEGGLEKTEEVDARGLLLLISGFGIPGVFKNDDIMDLIRVSNVKEISAALRRSVFLIPKIPELINWMVKNNMEIEAANIAYTFGLEDKCHPEIILTTFMQKTIKDEKHGSSAPVKEAMKKQLSNLKSLRRCLEAHKVDPAKLFPNSNVEEKIQQLLKDIKESDIKSSKENATKKRKAKEVDIKSAEEKTTQKRKAKEVDIKSAEEKATQKRKAKEVKPSIKPKQHETKRTRLNSHENMPQLQKSIDRFDRTLPSDYMSAYSENITGSVPIERAGGMLIGSYGTSLYGGTYLGQMVSNPTNGPSYGRHEDSSALVDRYLGQSYSRQDHLYNPQPPQPTGLIGLYSGSSGRPSLESFPGLLTSSPSTGFSARRGAASDLYSFADKVVVDDSHRNSRASGSGTMRSSYLY